MEYWRDKDQFRPACIVVRSSVFMCARSLSPHAQQMGLLLRRKLISAMTCSRLIAGGGHVIVHELRALMCQPWQLEEPDARAHWATDRAGSAQAKGGNALALSGRSREARLAWLAGVYRCAGQT